jgi:hypothetical protein
VERPTERPVQRSPIPLPPIPGTTVAAVAAGWTKLWDTPPKTSARGYDTKATLPGTDYNTRFGILKSAAGDGTEVGTLFCITSDQRLIRDGRFIRAVVDACLGPALRDEEKTTLHTWLTEQDYSGNVHEIRELPRFNAELVSAGNGFQVRLLSKGQTIPGAPPTTGTESTR